MNRKLEGQQNLSPHMILLFRTYFQNEYDIQLSLIPVPIVKNSQRICYPSGLYYKYLPTTGSLSFIIQGRPIDLPIQLVP